MTVQRIVDIAKLSQSYSIIDIKKKGLFGDGVDLNLPSKIYNVRKSVEWELGIEGLVDEVNAIGYVQINTTGGDGDSITIKSNDPILGVTTLDYYVNRTPSDNPTQFVVQAVTTWNTYYRNTGYTLEAVGDRIKIIARQGLGATINGSNISVEVTGGITTTITQFTGGVTGVYASEGLLKAANYLYALCAPYNTKAEYIITQGLGGIVVNPVNPSGYVYTSFTHVVTSDETGVNTFQNDILIGGLNLTSMVVNGNTYYLIAGDFSFNPTTGTITWNTGTFSTGDTITINFSRLI